MRRALIAAMTSLSLAGCGQSGSEAGGTGNGAVEAKAGGGDAGACEAFAGNWRNPRGDRLSIARTEGGFTVTSEVNVQGMPADSDSLTTRCDGGKLVGIDRQVGDITHDGAANQVAFMGATYSRAQ